MHGTILLNASIKKIIIKQSNLVEPSYLQVLKIKVASQCERAFSQSQPKKELRKTHSKKACQITYIDDNLGVWYKK